MVCVCVLVLTEMPETMIGTLCVLIGSAKNPIDM